LDAILHKSMKGARNLVTREERNKINSAYVVILTNSMTYGAEYWVREKREIREKSLRCLTLGGVWGINYGLKPRKKNWWERQAFCCG